MKLCKELKDSAFAFVVPASLLLLVTIGRIKNGAFDVKFFLMDVSEAFLLSFALIIIQLIFNLFKRIKPSKYDVLFLVFSFTFSIPYLIKLCGYSTTDIGSFYELCEYKEQYYVIMSREPETNKGRKSYMLPAEVERRSDCQYTTRITEDYYGNQCGGRDVYTLNYHINRLYFPNGGYLVFDYVAAYDNSKYTEIYVDKETEVTDYHGNTYYITLTKQKVKN